MTRHDQLAETRPVYDLGVNAPPSITWIIPYLIQIESQYEVLHMDAETINQANSNNRCCKCKFGGDSAIPKHVILRIILVMFISTTIEIGDDCFIL